MLPSTPTIFPTMTSGKTMTIRQSCILELQWIELSENVEGLPLMDRVPVTPHMYQTLPIGTIGDHVATASTLDNGY